MFVKYLNINELNIDEISSKVSNERLIKAEKYKSESDKKRSIAVEYLLNEMISEGLDRNEIQGVTDFKFPASITYDSKGKPHIYDTDGMTDLIHFSLSHSGDYVACMISNVSCGVDIERHSKRPYDKIARRVCKEGEKEAINSTKEFYDLWTLKESVLKAVGLGLSLDMRDFEMKKVDFVDEQFDYAETVIHYETKVRDIAYLGGVLSAPEGYSLSYIEELNNNR